MIDTHAHLDFDVYKDDFNNIAEEIKKAGIEKVIIPGVRHKDFSRIILLIEKYDEFYGAIGIHPSDVGEEWDESSYEVLKKYANHPKIVAIGETGLDYYHDNSTSELQKEVFHQHIKLAQELNKPLIIHDRDAHDDILNILKQYPDARGVMHCFSGDKLFAKECTTLGLYIAFGGIVTFKNAKQTKEAAQNVPLDKLLLETDSPFLSPHPFRGETNSPSKLPYIAEEIARLKNISVEELTKITTENANRLFSFSTPSF